MLLTSEGLRLKKSGLNTSPITSCLIFFSGSRRDAKGSELAWKRCLFQILLQVKSDYVTSTKLDLLFWEVACVKEKGFELGAWVGLGKGENLVICASWHRNATISLQTRIWTRGTRKWRRACSGMSESEWTLDRIRRRGRWCLRVLITILERFKVFRRGKRRKFITLNRNSLL